jgi:hypothetical protein
MKTEAAKKLVFLQTKRFEVMMKPLLTGHRNKGGVIDLYIANYGSTTDAKRSR